MLIKQLNYSIFSWCIPRLRFEIKKQAYFRGLKQQIGRERELYADKTQDNDTFTDEIERTCWAILGKQLRTVRRAVLRIGQNGEEMTQTRIADLNLDAVELNSFYQKYESIQSSYQESIVDFGYTTMFAAAFPLGPLVLVLMNIVEIKSKINVFLFIQKRPKCYKAVGIG